LAIFEGNIQSIMLTPRGITAKIRKKAAEPGMPE